MNSVSNRRTQQMLVSSVLIALGIMIPMIMPIKIIIGPASYTLASHVPIFIGLFISPFVALSVTAGTTLGFLLSGFAPIIVLRAASHFFFVIVALYLNKQFEINKKPFAQQLSFYFLINLVHGLGEVIAVYLFSMSAQTTNAEGFFFTLFILVGVGTVIHGMVDFILAHMMMKRIKLPHLA